MTEFGLIDHIRALCASLPSNGFEGIGDDCAILPLGDGESLVFTSDMLCEGIHFLRNATTPAELGAKSLAVNLSDVAAMGARPVATLLSLSLPSDAMGWWVESFMDGYRELSARYGVALVGGDTTASKGGISISVTAIGRVSDTNIKRRSAACVNDIILTTGKLGESGIGLQHILSNRHDTPQAHTHRNPLPQIEEGVWLGGRPEVHAMMDISDGVASDIRHIMERSHLGAQIELNSVPAHADIETALSGGEDYKLLLTAETGRAEQLCCDFETHFGTPLYPIGCITAQQELLWLRHGEPQTKDYQGFRHY